MSRVTAAALRLAWARTAAEQTVAAAAVATPRKAVVATPHAHVGFQRRSLRVSSTGHETDTLTIGDPALAELTVVCVPGNPGNALFYAPFMRKLHELGTLIMFLIYIVNAHSRSYSIAHLITLHTATRSQILVFFLPHRNPPPPPP